MTSRAPRPLPSACQFHLLLSPHTLQHCFVKRSGPSQLMDFVTKQPNLRAICARQENAHQLGSCLRLAQLRLEQGQVQKPLLLLALLLVVA